jgi:hypothetical protein
MFCSIPSVTFFHKGGAMSKHAQAVVATVVMILFAFGSLPSSNKSSSTSVSVPTQSPPTSTNSDTVQKPSGPNLKGVDAETRTQYTKLVEEHRMAMTAWQEERDTIRSLEGKLKELEAKAEKELAQKPESPNFEEREWSSEDGKYKVTATLLDSDFKLAKLKKADGSIVEVSKEKLSAADKQTIERSFAVIEVAARREKEWIDRLTALEEENKEIQTLIDQANQPAPEAPTIELAKQMVDELRNNIAAEKLKQEVEEAEKKGTIHPSQIEILETRVVERVNANGVTMDMIECKFQNNSKRSVRIIDCTYLAYNKNGKKVFEKPYTLFAVDDSNKGLPSGEWQDTVGNGLFIPKKLEATSAKVVITKVLERDDSQIAKEGETVANDSHVTRFITLVGYQPESRYITRIGRNQQTIIVYVSDAWHFLPYQIRLQLAQNIWATWATATKAPVPDHARVDIRDNNGNSVGGSKLLGGSLSWVSK